MVNKASTRAALAVCLAMAIFSTHSMVGLASPEQKQAKVFGELTVSGQVSVDGQALISGATFFPDSNIVTGENANATVNFNTFGRVQYAPNSSSKLGLTETGTRGSLDAGRVSVSKPQGASATFTTKDGLIVADTNQPTVFTVDVTNGNTVVAAQQGRVELRAVEGIKTISAGQTGTAGATGRDAGNSYNFNKKKVAILSVIAGIIAIIIIVATRGSDNTTPTPVISPSR